MSKDTLEVLSANQSERIDRINEYNAGFHDAFGQQMGNAFLAGMELNALKAEIPHGKFMDFCARYLADVSKSSVQRYMAFADGLQPKLPTMGNLKLLTNGRIPEKEKEEVLKAVHDYADGKSLTQLYRDLGVIRQPEKQKHSPVTLTAEEKLQADLKAAADLFHDARGAIDILFEDEAIFAKVPPALRNELMAAALRLTKKLRTFKGKRTLHRNKKDSK